MYNIIADENIPFVTEAFSTLGNVTTCSGRDLTSGDVKDADILLVRSVTEVNKALLKGSKIKFIASATAGLNHIDLNYLKKQNIAFANAPGSNAISAAEYVISGICHWSLLNNKPLDSLSLGIIGFGNVGSRVQQYAKALGIECIASDPPLEDAGIKGLNPLNEILKCDIVTLHVPLTISGGIEKQQHPTLKLLDKTAIDTLKPGCLLINAARGGVIHEQALLDRIHKNNDLTLILDVWENEPNINLQLLHKTLIGTPHIAGYSLDGKIRGTEMIYHACCNFLHKKPTWSVAELELPDGNLNDIDQRQDIRQQIVSAYDICADDQRLKQLLDDKQQMSNLKAPGEYFDQLRKNYPVRREFGEQIIFSRLADTKAE